MLTVLVSAPYIIPIIDRFQHVFEEHLLKLIIADVYERLSEEQVLAYAGQFDGTLCGDDLYSARVLEACAPRLKVISKWGTGIDSIDQQAARRLGIKVCRTPNAFTLPVADTVLGYILAFARQHPRMDRDMKTGKWEKSPGARSANAHWGLSASGTLEKP